MQYKSRYPWTKGIVSWRQGRTLCLSIPFTWLIEDARVKAEAHDGPVVIGGPAAMLCKPTWATIATSTSVDVLAMHNPYATFTTRGCPNHCGFCAVPQIEPAYRELTDWKPKPIVCDNNLLAASKAHFRSVVDTLRWLRFVDFNQGLESARLTKWHAEQLARLKNPMVRFAFDHVDDERDLVDALLIARRAGLRTFGVYVLVGFRDTPDDAIYRLERVRALGIRPNVMRYQPLRCSVRNAYLDGHWTEDVMRDVVSYYSRLRWLEHIPFATYQETRHD